MKNKDCNLVRDLLPNYVENLTNEDTNLFIENHLRACSECTTILNSMKSGENENEKNKSKKFVNFSKKFRKKYKILKYIVLIIILLFFVHFIRNFIILTYQYKHMDECINLNNYHVRWYFYQSDEVIFEDTYFKDGKALKMSSISPTNHFDDTLYPLNYLQFYDNNNQRSYGTDRISGIKFYQDSESNYTHEYAMLNVSYRPSFLELICQSALSRIDSTKCNGIDCYRIISQYDGYNQYSYFDKKTGFLVRGTNPVTLQNGQEFLAMTDIFIEFGNVTDEDLRVPNEDEYKPFEEVKSDLMLSELKEAINNNELERIKSDLKYMLDENIEIPSEYYDKYKYLLEE